MLRADVLIGRAGMLKYRLEAVRLFLGHIHLQEHTVKRVNTFKCKGSMLARVENWTQKSPKRKMKIIDTDEDDVPERFKEDNVLSVGRLEMDVKILGEDVHDSGKTGYKTR